MKKRILAMAFAMMMAFGVAACGGAEKDEHEGHDHAEEQQETALDETSEYLQSLPSLITVEDAVAEGFFAINDGVSSNQEAWDAFVAAATNGEEAEVVVCQYTMKGGVVLDHLSYKDGSYVVITDTTRDGYDDEKSVLKAAETYKDMKVFENFSLEEGGKTYTICVLSDNPDLTADEFRTHWINMTAEDNHIYMLYVI